MEKLKTFIKKMPFCNYLLHLRRLRKKNPGILKRLTLLKHFFSEYKIFIKANEIRSELKVKECFPYLNDATISSTFDSHYIYHPAWAARILSVIKPDYHIDISSSLAFSTIVSAFIPVKFYDYRPANLFLSNLTSEHADLTALPFSNESIGSLSCMHTVEHIGLGRYGEPIDPNGDIKAIKELTRVLSRGGNLLFVVPIGKPKIVFNAHRIYSYEQILKYFHGLSLKEFSLIPDQGREIGIIKDASKEIADKQEYGCGCFWFIKPIHDNH